VLFRVGRVQYGIAIECIREVINPQPVFEMPEPVPFVTGVTDYRGEVVPVLDMRQKLDLPPLDDPEAIRKTKWMLTNVGGPSQERLVAVVVDTVIDVLTTSEPLRPHPTKQGFDSQDILGVVPANELGFVFVVSPMAIRRHITSLDNIDLAEKIP
jgi:purine-binding chemotaxis protein CheW